MFNEETPLFITQESKKNLVNSLNDHDFFMTQEVIDNPPTSTLNMDKPFYYRSNYEQDLKANMRKFNLFPAISRFLENQQLPDADPNYDPFQDPQLEKYGSYVWRFADSSSEAETALRIKRFEQDRDDTMTIAESTNISPMLIASGASPLLATPVAPLAVMRSGSAIKRFLGGAAFAMAVYLPEESFIDAMSEDRQTSDLIYHLTAGSLFQGILASAFGKTGYRGFRQTMFKSNLAYEPPPTIAKESDNMTPAGPKVNPGVGANINPASPLYRQQMYTMMDEDSLVETGVKLEKLPWNPVLRLAQSPNPISRKVFAKIVDVGGLIQKKVLKEEAMDQSVEVNFRTKYIGLLVDATRRIDFEYLQYRGLQPRKGEIGRSVQKIRQSISDKLRGNNGKISDYDFRVRVTKALRNGGKDLVDDAATPFVNKAARNARQVFNKVKDEAQSVKLFEKEVRGIINGLKEAIAKTKNATKKQQLEDELKNATAKLQQIMQHGPSINTAKGYVTRIPRIDKLMENKELFIQRVSQWALGANFGYDTLAARKFAQKVHDQYTRSKPYFDLDEGVSQIDWVKNPGSVKERSFLIPDEIIEDFLENDIEAILRHYTKTMGTDIELMRMFGSIDMKNILKEVTDEYKLLMKDVSGPALKKLQRQMDRDIADIKGLRDRVRGTYGASKDPHQMSSRYVRAMKSFNVMVGMGNATISSIPDVIRTVMTEGLMTTYEKGISKWFSHVDDTLKKLKARELRAAGVAGDASLGLRSHAYADIGDTFGSRFGVERKLYNATNVFFILNGLNYWNQMMKEFAGGVIMFRMTDSIMKPWASLSTGAKEKLLKAGIDEVDAFSMKQLITKHGRKENGEWFPNTDLWPMKERQLFRNALNQAVDRTIVTPGAGDRALWTSTEFGSLITQFRGFGQGATIRVLTSGLQEREGAFYQGAIGLIGLAYMVNQFKRIQYGMDREQDMSEKLLDAIDRSGVLGYFMDFNNALEKITDYKLGLGPFLTNRDPFPMPFGAKIGALFGPAAQNVNNAIGVTADILTGQANAKTLESSRFLVPGGNIAYLDPIYDGIFNYPKNVNSKSN